ncbi:hypothetical protein RCO22_18840 [Pseudomonas yamanorum]|uniref:Uncharacterized protein n=1 Tax=Pseudomonas yamanorum TaxID=515393 RepID=A0ABU1CUQ4_9PSED|nr:hypothetical protein [Pseudomonas yamanorum]MDR0191006.1 hypothetical protein [Pseudomonas yamanorum]
MTEQSNWFFAEKHPGDKARDPVQDEFFQDQSLDGISHALVRETIQNSLDARIGKAPVKVVLSIGSLPAADAGYWFPSSSHGHFEAEEIKLGSLPRWGSEDCNYLTIEDFGTKGLEGRIDSFDPSVGGNFYHFFRAEGISNKKEGDRGSWGIGKIVIPRASRARSFFAVTRRVSEPGLHLMGQAILRHHSINEKMYTPDGWFSRKLDNGLQIPFSDDEFTSRLKRDFNLRRKEEPGLGLVIPWIYEEINFNELASVIAREYFIPILAGDLEIELLDSKVDKAVLFDSCSIELLKSSAPDHKDFQDSIELAGYLFGLSEEAPLVVETVHSSGGNTVDYDWANYVTQPPSSEIDEALDQGRVLHFKVPMAVKPTKGALEIGCFDVLLKRESGRHYATYVRDGLLIPNQVQARKKTPNHIALVYAGSPSGARNIVADALGKSECPAHTDWSGKREKFLGQYSGGNRLIPFVRDSAYRLAERLSSNDDKPDHSLLADLLPMPVGDSSRRVVIGKDKDGTKKRVSPELVVPDIPPVSPRCWRMRQAKDVILISGHEAGFQNHAKYVLTIQAAYDLTGRNPYAAHSLHDFSLIVAANKGIDERSGFRIAHNEHVQIIGGKAGVLEIAVVNPGFEISFLPSDLNRDLVMKVSARTTEELGDDGEEE